MLTLSLPVYFLVYIKIQIYSLKERERQLSGTAEQLLLKLNPKDRLGAGRPGSTNDYTMLMKHPYF